MYRSCGVMTLSRMPGGSPANCARYASGLDAVFIKSAIMYSRLMPALWRRIANTTPVRSFPAAQSRMMRL